MAYPQHPEQPQGSPWPPPPRKKRRVWPWVLLGVIALSIAGFAACTAAVGGAIDSASAPATVRYELIGDGTATTVTYSTDGGTSQESQVTLPWTKDVQFGDAFLSVTTLTGQRGDGDGSLMCRITNTTTGAVIAESTSSGSSVVVSCSGSANQPTR